LKFYNIIYALSYVDMNPFLNSRASKMIYRKSQWVKSKHVSCTAQHGQFVTQKILSRGFVPPRFGIEFLSIDFVSKIIRTCFPNVIMYSSYMKYFLPRSKLTTIQIQYFFYAVCTHNVILMILSPLEV